MSYTPLEWKDGPQGGTPITAAALNRMEQGIVDAHTEVDAIKSQLDTLDTIIRNLLLNHWAVFHSGTSENLYGVAYGNGLWVAVGATGTILTSTNGTPWVGRASGTTSHLRGVAYGNDLWVAVGDSGTIRTSTNGTSWTSR